MRCKVDRQEALEFEPSNLKVTNEYYRRYETISRLLDESPAILERIHSDLGCALGQERKRNRAFLYTSDTVLRILVAQVCEGESLRGIVVRVDDSWGLRRFARIYHGPMMDYSTLCRLKNAIQPKTWAAVNELLTESAIDAESIVGDELRLDTTAVETNKRHVDVARVRRYAPWYQHKQDVSFADMRNALRLDIWKTRIPKRIRRIAANLWCLAGNAA